MHRTSKNKENNLHWTEEKEAVHSQKPILLLISLIKKLPLPLVYSLIYPVGLFYTLFNKRARIETKHYQNIMHEYTKGKTPSKVSTFKQVKSFALCILEKLAAGLEKIPEDSIHFNQNSDFQVLKENLKNKKGGLLIFSHLGNIEILQSAFKNSSELDGIEPELTIIREYVSTAIFDEISKSKMNSNKIHILNSSDFGIPTICDLQDRIDNGGFVIIAGDRTSAKTGNRYIKQNFLGKEAAFPYGTFLLCALLDSPVYFINVIRNKAETLHPINSIEITKAKTNFSEYSRSERDEKIQELCKEFAEYLEVKALQNPYQWYNFFNFWHLPDSNITN